MHRSLAHPIFVGVLFVLAACGSLSPEPSSEKPATSPAVESSLVDLATAVEDLTLEQVQANRRQFFDSLNGMGDEERAAAIQEWRRVERERMGPPSSVRLIGRLLDPDGQPFVGVIRHSLQQTSRTGGTIHWGSTDRHVEVLDGHFNITVNTRGYRPQVTATFEIEPVLDPDPARELESRGFRWPSDLTTDPWAQAVASPTFVDPVSTSQEVPVKDLGDVVFDLPPPAAVLELVSVDGGSAVPVQIGSFFGGKAEPPIPFLVTTDRPVQLFGRGSPDQWSGAVHDNGTGGVRYFTLVPGEHKVLHLERLHSIRIQHEGPDVPDRARYLLFPAEDYVATDLSDDPIGWHFHFSMDRARLEGYWVSFGQLNSSDIWFSPVPSGEYVLEVFDGSMDKPVRTERIEVAGDDAQVFVLD
tara:strand:+ start:2954 stop:4195 length:1242 start_codon:yes stop_codon:yes gene_type:complete